MNLNSISTARTTALYAKAAVAGAPAEIRQARADAPAAAPTGYDPRLTAREAGAAALVAAQAVHDVRQTGPSDMVRRFDRMACVIEGFEHMREVIDGMKVATAEEFGLTGQAADGADAAPQGQTLDQRA